MYRIVLSMPEWPSHCRTVRRSTPAHNDHLVNVALNLWNQPFSLSYFAASRRKDRRFHLITPPETMAQTPPGT